MFARPLASSLGQATRSSLRSQAAPVRTYASGAGKSGGESNLPLVLGLGGLGGLAAWYSLGGFGDAKKAPAANEAASAGAATATATATGTALNKDAFVEFKLKEIKPYNHDSATYVFEIPDGKKPGMSVASAVVLKAVGDGLKDDKGKDVIRPYTPVTSPDTAGHIDFLIKRYPGGKMTNHVHNLKPGESIAIKGPIPKWPYKANEFEHIGLIAGGSGITPMWQLAQQIASDPSDKTKVTLIYTNKTEDDILMREEWDRLAKDSRFTIVYGLDKKPSNFTGFEGHVDQSILGKNLPLPGLANKAKVFVCGPPPQVAAVCGPKGPKGSQGELKGLLADLGYQPDQVYKF